MTSVETKQIMHAVYGLVGTCKGKKEDAKGDIFKVTLPLEGSNRRKFNVYLFRRTGSKKLLLSDGRAITTALQAAGLQQFAAIQALLSTYGLSLMEDLSVMDLTNRTLTKRFAAFLQIWVVIDGMLRMWETTKEQVNTNELPTAS